MVKIRKANNSGIMLNDIPKLNAIDLIKIMPVARSSARFFFWWLKKKKNMPDSIQNALTELKSVKSIFFLHVCE